MTRDIAGKFNQAYRSQMSSRIPQPIVLDKEAMAKVPGTDGQKMSKSYGNTIDIFAEGKPLEKRSWASRPTARRWASRSIRTRATCSRCTACSPRRRKRRPWPSDYRAGKIGYGEAKKLLKTKIDELFAPAREKRKQLAQDASFVEDVLREAPPKARAEAQATMALAREVVGMRF